PEGAQRRFRADTSRRRPSWSAVKTRFNRGAHMADFVLSSPDIPSGGTIPQHFEFDGFGCSGRNESPALQWEGAPADAKSFALTVYDPDAPTGSGWWHWFVVDLPAGTTSLAP